MQVSTHTILLSQIFYFFSIRGALCKGGVVGYETFLAMVTLISFFMPGSNGLPCPSSCSTLSPVPYPFGAALGCGSPGFYLDCSFSPPQWNISSGGYTGSYYIVNVSSNPNYSNPQAGSYGYGGIALSDVRPSYTNSTCHVLSAASSATNNFVSSDLAAFQYADLRYYQNSYLFFNCSNSEEPATGVLINSSLSCAIYLEYCGFSTSSCLEYIPDQQLQLSIFNNIYHCSTRTRFVITPGDENISTWKPYNQFAWGPVRDADSCNACQRTGGTCGYEPENESFLCYCGNGVSQKDCNSGNSKAIALGVSIPTIFLFLVGIAFACRHKCGMLASRKLLKLDGINEAALELPYWLLSAATKSFSTKIGQGAFSNVFKGLLCEGNEVAVKVLRPSEVHTDDQFWSEVATIGNIHHMNIAKLVGYCFKRSNRILVYEYVSNGSLDKYLFPQNTEADVPVLDWKQRIEIALGVARGLSYMHEECRRCIIHCDIKPQNILLDDAFCPKIADFGLARLLKREESKVMTHARGTPGYVAPEFWSGGSGNLSTKSDVYSYGLLLLEIIRGRKSFENFDPFCAEDIDSFVAVSIDERIGDKYDYEQAQMCTWVALWCIQGDPATRPTMNRVVQFLQGTTAVPDNPPRPFRTIIQRQKSSDAFLSSFNNDSSNFSMETS